jgi:pyruvyl transferase EpsI
VRPYDIFFLHSGGNLGDKGLWSEGRRRQLISAFTDNRIISLPQTICFTNTPKGEEEREKTRQIYASHPNLTIMARDFKSEEIAQELFPNARIICIPDFVLSLNRFIANVKNTSPRILLCLRNDKESALSETEKKKIAEMLPYECTYFDTSTAKNIEKEDREKGVDDIIKLFCNYDAVITDRLHGVVFAVLCRKPCVALGGVDHKIVSSMEWFKEISFVKFARFISDIPALLEKCLLATDYNVPDWNA